jgi:hypothetical protein
MSGKGASTPDRQDRQLVVPVVVVLVTVAEPLAPSVVSVVGVRLRQPDEPGGKRAASVSIAVSWCGRTMFVLLTRKFHFRFGIHAIHGQGYRRHPR